MKIEYNKMIRDNVFNELYLDDNIKDCTVYKVKEDEKVKNRVIDTISIEFDKLKVLSTDVDMLSENEKQILLTRFADIHSLLNKLQKVYKISDEDLKCRVDSLTEQYGNFNLSMMLEEIDIDDEAGMEIDDRVFYNNLYKALEH